MQDKTALNASQADPRHALQVPAYRRYWIYRVASVLAIQMQSIAVGYQVYDIARRTHSPQEAAWYLGMVGLAVFVPLFGMTLPAGQLADRFDRRRIVLLCLLLELVAMGGLFLVTLKGSAALAPVFACLVLMGFARGLQTPSVNALAPNLVPRALLPSAIALGAMAWQGAAIAGPALGGYLYILGAETVYAIGMALLALALAMMLMIRSPARTSRPDPVTLETFLGGLRFVRGQPMILGAITLDLFAVLLGGAVAMLPAYARDILAVGPEGLGHLRAAPAAGAAVVGLWLARWPLKDHVGRTMFLSVGVFAVMTIIFGLSTHFWLSMAALVILGGADMISIYVRASLIQLNTPDAMRGRVSAVSTLCVSASNELGEFESGVTARLMGVVPAVVAGGVLALIITVAWARLFPSLYAADRLDQSPVD